MPLKSQVPAIDDRRFDDIVAEIRARIPHYSPEWKPVWNDLNDSDPGVVLAQVFAHLSEMLLYRMARVPDLAYVKFLELMGVELTPAQPARVEVSFTVDSKGTDPIVNLPPRLQVAAPADSGAPLVFETERALSAIACTLNSVQRYDGAYYRDATEDNAGGAPFAPFGDLPRVDAALVLGFGFSENYDKAHRENRTGVLPFPALPIDLAVWVAGQQDKPLVRQCGPATGAAHAPARVRWEAWDGTDWQGIDALSDETLAFTRGGHIVVRVSAAAAARMRADHIGAYEATGHDNQMQPPLFWLRARLTQSQYTIAPRLLSVRTNTVPAQQAQSVFGEVLGGTGGQRAQVFQLGNAPVLAEGLRIRIDEGLGENNWEARADLFGSGPTDHHLMLNRTSGEVVTGDGENGAIPVANAGNPDANVIADYRFGGGARGNVGAGRINRLLTPVAGVDGGKTTNPFAASGGRDEESLEDARKRARLSLRAHDRAVSSEDFELLARQAGNVRRAKALPLAHPRFPGIDVPGTVTVIVVPDADPALTRMPLPGDGLLRTVCEYLDARRLLTTELFVVAPRYVRVEVRSEIVARDEADPGHVHLEIEEALLAYLHPLSGGDDGAGWPFGGPIRYSKVTQRVYAVEGVDSIRSLVLLVGGEEQAECRDVTIAPNALVYSEAHSLTVASLREFEGTA